MCPLGLWSGQVRWKTSPHSLLAHTPNMCRALRAQVPSASALRAQLSQRRARYARIEGWLSGCRLCPGSTLSTHSRHTLDTLDTLDTSVNRHHPDTASTLSTLSTLILDTLDALTVSTRVNSVNGVRTLDTLDTLDTPDTPRHSDTANTTDTYPNKEKIHVRGFIVSCHQQPTHCACNISPLSCKHATSKEGKLAGTSLQEQFAQQ